MKWYKIGREFVYPDYKPMFPRDPEYKLLSVDLELKLNFMERRAFGKVLHKVEALTNISSIKLDAVDMEITSVHVNGKDVDFSYDGSVLEIYPGEIKKGEKAEVEIEYVIEKPRKGLYFVPFDSDEPAYQVWTQGEAEDTRYWIPIYDYPNMKAKVKLSLIVPSNYIAVANGRLIGKEKLEDGYCRWTWLQEEPISIYLIAFIAGDFHIREDEVDGLKLMYIVPRGREEDIERSFSKTPKMIKFFEEFTGVKFPYVKYAQACVTDFVAGGMENVSLTILTESTLHDEHAHMDFRSEPLVAHELAHQWFGDLVTCRDWSHIWLNESFATFMEILWRRFDLGEDEFIYGLIGMMDSYLSEYGRYSRPIVMRIYGSPDELFDAHSYPKGALILRMLMEILGEDGFRKAIKSYLGKYSNRTADTEDLRKVFEEVCGLQLDWFFEQYIYNAGHPVLKVRWKWINEDKMLEVNIEQTQKDDSWSEYRLPLEIEVVGDKPVRKKLWITEKSKTIYVKLDRKPKAVLIDPEFKTFKALNLDVGIEELINIIEASKYLYPRVMAVRKLGEKGGLKAIKKLHEILVNEDEFWGLRREAAKALGKIGSSDALDKLVEALKTAKHPKVRRAIVEALGSFKEDKVVKPLIEVLRNSRESYYVRASAVLSLAKTRHRDAFNELVKALEYKSHNHVILTSALEGLGILELNESKEIILKYVKDKSIIVKSAAISALGYFTSDRRIREILSSYAKHPHPRVRGAVISAIEKSMDERLLEVLDQIASTDIHGGLRRRARDAAKKIRKHMEKGVEYRKLREELEKIRREERRLVERIERLEAKGAYT